MTIVAKLLANGQLPATAATLYTVPASTTAYIKSINLNNTGIGSSVVQLWVQPSGGSSRRIAYATLLANETLVDDTPRVLNADAVMLGAATTATDVDYVISGAEEA